MRGVAAFVLACVLGGVCRAESVPAFAEFRVQGGQETKVIFPARLAAPGEEAVLTLRARMDYEKPAGCNAALRLSLNGKPVVARRMLNKPQRAQSRGGDIYSLGAGENLVLFYSPDFLAPDSDPYYGLAAGYPACYFELRVTDLLVANENALTIANTAGKDYTLVAAEGKIDYRPAQAAAAAGAAAPTGDLPVIVPAASQLREFTARELPENVVEVVSGGETFTFQTRYAVPNGWTTAATEQFSLARSIEPGAEAVVVTDTLKNLSDAPLPLAHQTTAAFTPTKVWLGGLEQPDGAGQTTAPMNPTVCATKGNAGVGLLPLDDVYRVHAEARAGEGVIALADRHLVLAPGKSYTCSWAILPFDAAEGYWGFINGARRLLDVNFEIDGGFAFLRNGPLTDAWSDQQLGDFIRFKDAKYLCASIAHPMYNGTYSHGTSFQRIALDSYVTSFERWRALSPERKCLVYFHCFIDVVEDGPTLFADARHLNADGSQADYGDAVNKLYVPLDDNSYGPAVAKNIDLIFDTTKADGVYWDEQEYSRFYYTYAEPWDGYSGDIDPTTHALIRKKSSVTLITEAWRLALAKKILARGPLIANGPCLTQARRALKFPAFVETGSISNCTQAHLYSPIALGDHLTERSEEDAYGVMLAALDFGCVYHWYNDMTVLPTHPHLTSYMFPITPIELREGCIIGKERIVTNRSGRYGWGDASAHEAHVFDASGRESKEPAAVAVTVDGETYTDLRIPAGWSAAIVRR